MPTADPSTFCVEGCFAILFLSVHFIPEKRAEHKRAGGRLNDFLPELR